MKTRCECRNLSFAGLLAYARRHGTRTVDELSKATTCCTGCGSCRPYLEELLRSGKLHVGDELIDFPYNPDEPLNVPGKSLGSGES
jgi:NAD(P)H-nitrite reductase large subunit